ncbi:MAG: xanthine dehydrogenase accessory protein XdhC [Asticcacaulis sp.]|nr:xanthine dehydrogenase accessory protein XdhC [Asticcacaulis sp.]
MTSWATKAWEWIQAGEPCALIAILAAEGSTPREAGTRMVVTRSQICGTIGGGNLEFQVIDQARQALKHPAGTWRIQDYPLGVLLGQCCGGRVRVLIEHLDPVQSAWLEVVKDRPAFGLKSTLLSGGIGRDVVPVGALPLTARGPIPAEGDVLIETVVMFGAGHVGLAIARVLKDLPFALAWYDDRSDVPAAVRVLAADDLCGAAAMNDGLTLILTHDHALDYELTRAALASKASFIGLIGSKTKRQRFFSRLTKAGYGEDDLKRIHCPIGIDGIDGKAPEIIAVSVAAQLLTEAQKVISPLPVTVT